MQRKTVLLLWTLGFLFTFLAVLTTGLVFANEHVSLVLHSIISVVVIFQVLFIVVPVVFSFIPEPKKKSPKRPEPSAEEDKQAEENQSTVDTLDEQIREALDEAVSAAENQADQTVSEESRKVVQRAKNIDFLLEIEELGGYFTIIYVAYLPNEKDIIMESILHTLKCTKYPSDKFEVLLAYNSPEAFPEVEGQIAKLQAECENFRFVKVLDSKSKAENINYALEHMINYEKTKYIGIYDTDHLPDTMSLHIAARDLMKHDIVQGQCVIRNKNETLMTRLVSAEFNMIYGIAHPGRYRFNKVAFFGGSNGFWRADLIRKIGMDQTMQTEDVDSCARAIVLENAKIKFNPNIKSYEMAPKTFGGYFNQRIRWAQGWYQVSKKHCGGLVKRSRNPLQFFSYFFLFFIRESLHYISLIMTAEQIAILIKGLIKMANDPHFKFRLADFLEALTIKTVKELDDFRNWLAITGIVLTAIAMLREGYRTKNLINVCLMLLLNPLLIAFNVIISVYAHFREWTSTDEWVVTKR